MLVIYLVNPLGFWNRGLSVSKIRQILIRNHSTAGVIMVRINHARWELKIKDNFIREIQRGSKIYTSDLRPDRADSRSAPPVSFRFAIVTEDLLGALIEDVDRKATLWFIERIRKNQIDPYPRRPLANTNKGDRKLFDIAMVMLADLLDKNKDVSSKAWRWLGWRFPEMNTDGHRDEIAMSYFIDIFSSLHGEFTEMKARMSFAEYEKFHQYFRQSQKINSVSQRGDEGYFSSDDAGRKTNITIPNKENVAVMSSRATNRLAKQSIKKTDGAKRLKRKILRREKLKNKEKERIRSENTSRFLDRIRVQNANIQIVSQEAT